MPRTPTTSATPKITTLVRATTVTLLVLAAATARADQPAQGIPAGLQAAFAALPESARPVELRSTPDGVIYALLPNGAELIALEKRTAPVVSVQAWVRTGSVDEQEWTGAGLSHFCEHLLFKGTTKRPTGQLDQDIRGGGGDNNAYTTNDRTVYHVTTASTGFAGAFDAIADMVMNSTFPPEEVKKEHGVVRKEIERGIDDPERTLWETFEQTLYQVHPYRVPVLGYIDRFDRVTRDEVYAYYKRRYAPQMTSFIAVGDFDSTEALPLMARTVAGWARTSVAPAVIPPEPEQVAPREVVISHHLCKVPKLMLGFPSVSQRSPDLYALDVLASVLGSGRSSRLYQTVKDKQKLVLDVQAFDETPNDPGYFGVVAAVEPGNVAAARAAILDVVDQARRQAPTPDELSRVKRQIQADRVFGEMTAEGLAEQIGNSWFSAGDLDFSRVYVDRIEKVTPDDVVAAAKKYLDPTRLNVVLLTPPGNAAGGPAAEAAPVAAPASADGTMASEFETLRAIPEVRSADAHVLHGAPVFEVELKSGLRVVTREDTSIAAVHGAIATLGGQRSEPADKAGASNLVAQMLDRGSRAFTKTELAARVEGMGATLAPFGGRNTFGLQFRCLSGDLPKMLGLAAESFLGPAFPTEELEALRKETLAEIDEQEENLATLDLKLLRSLVFGSHPYGRPVLGTKETVGGISAADLAALHHAWTRPEASVVSFSGDLHAVDAVRDVLDSFRSFPPEASGAQQPAPIAPLTAAHVETKEVAGLTGAAVALGFQGVKIGDPDREVLDVIDALLTGLGGRLYLVLREKLGIAYVAEAMNDVQLDGGFFTFFIQTDPQNIDRSEQAFRAEIAKLRNTPVPAKELDTIKSFLAGTEAISLQDQGNVALHMGLATLYHEGLDSVFTRHEKLAQVTAAEIQAVSRKYFDADRYALAVVKPAP